MNPDYINAGIQFTAGIVTWRNCFRLHVDKGYAGIDPYALFFYISWGGWNLYWYSYLHQWVSFVASINVTVANLVWISLMFYYGRKV